MIDNKFLLLDVGDTLVSITEPFEVYTSKALESILRQKEVFSVENLDSFITFRNEFRKSAHDSLIEGSIVEFIQSAFKDVLSLEIDSAMAMQLEKAYVQAELNITVLCEDTVNFLKYAAECDREIYLATNNFSIQHVYSLIDKFKLEKYLKGVHISASCSHRKPDKLFLDSFFKQFEASPDSSIIIGDKYNMDVLCGKNFGIQTCLINRKSSHVNFEQGPPDFVFNSLSEIEFSQL